MLAIAGAPDLDPCALRPPDDLERGPAARPSCLDESRRREAVERARGLHRRCVRERPDAPDVFRPAGGWRACREERRSLRDAIVAGEDERAGERLRGLRHDERGAMVTEHAGCEQPRRREQLRTDRVRRTVRRKCLVRRQIAPADPTELALPDVGERWGPVLDDVLVTPKATRFHALARPVAELVRDVAAPVPAVVEVGAGFGGTATCRLRDEPGVRQLDPDLPEAPVIAARPGTDVVVHGERPAAEPLAADGPSAPSRRRATPSPRCPRPRPMRSWTPYGFSGMPRRALDRTLAELTRGARGFLPHHDMDPAGVVNRGHERIPASSVPLDPRDRGDRLRPHVGFDHLPGRDGDGREHLLQRIRPTGVA